MILCCLEGPRICLWVTTAPTEYKLIAERDENRVLRKFWKRFCESCGPGRKDHPNEIPVKRILRVASVGGAVIGAAFCAASQAPALESGTATSSPVAAADSTAPKLVVMLVVDQLRADLLDRYADLYTGGFKRLRDQGYSYVNAAHDHSSTETAVGHASLATGVHPNRHGVVSNVWYEMYNGAWKQVISIDDSTVQIVGVPGRLGASPRHLMRPGFAEWLVAANPQSKVASVAGKDRSAIHPAAHTKGFVYWFDGGAGRFVTSTYYRSADPDWVTAFNSGPLQSHRADTVWNLQAPASVLARANADTSTVEGDGVLSYFPHRFSDLGRPESFWPWWIGTPNIDAATLDFAEAMVSSLELGRDDAPDFLNVSLSATDAIGHGYGPHSREQFDNLLRLDRELGQFFDYLDSKVGKGRWTIMLTADHGVLDMPEDLVKRRQYGHRITPAEVEQLNNLRADAMANPDKRAGARKLVADLKKLPLVADAWLRDDLMKGQPTDSFAVLQKRSLYEGRLEGWVAREGVEFRFKPGILTLPRGTNHGSTYWYDRHVPMIFMGGGIPAGKDPSRAATVDMAPTFAAMLGIPYPKDLDGKVLSAVVRR